MNTATNNIDAVVEEQKAYYNARAAEYDDWWLRKGAFEGDAEHNRLWLQEGSIVSANLQSFLSLADKNILELAPGTGVWSKQLYRENVQLSLIDSSAEMLRYNPVAGFQNVAVIIADLLKWQPTREYDLVFMGFWLSHVPQATIQSFIEKVAKSLKKDGKMFFVDNKRIAAEQKPHVVHEYEEFAVRRLASGLEFTIVKNYYEPAALSALFSKAGMDIRVHETQNFFQYGYGTKIN